MDFTNDLNKPDVIELKGVEKSYGVGDKKKVIIKDFNFLIERNSDVVNGVRQNQFKTILGPSGCGKSTVLRMIAGLTEPSNGKVIIDGKEIIGNPNIGMVFQKYSNFPWLTVLENVALGLKLKGTNKAERNEIAMEMIQLVGLDGHEDKYAQYPTLSGGQLQRVAIARSLVSSPNILLMDEPFGALDVKTRLQMQDLLVKIYETVNPTIIFVTHDIQEAVYLSDDIYIMGTAPSKFIMHYDITLPFNRSGIKRDPKFMKIVEQIEDYMMSIK
jgi:NitT/TauT family transport system ATP-binding protein